MDKAKLTASEIVLLNGAQFAPKGGLLDKFRPLGTEDDVSKKQLAQLVYAAAFLDMQRAGCLTLTFRPKKALLGLRTVQALYADPVGERGPEASAGLEARLWDVARDYKNAKGQNEVQTIVYAYMGGDSADPFKDALERVYGRLADRGLLDVVEERKLKIFTSRHFVLPDSTAAIVPAGVAETRQLLDACRQGQPELWKKLIDSINDALSSRREKTDTDND